MPAHLVAFPGTGSERMAKAALGQLLDDDGAPFETFNSVGFTGVNGGVAVSGLYVEVDAHTWMRDGIFTFAEVSESDSMVVLFDASRNVTVTIDYANEAVTVSFKAMEFVYEMDGVTQSFAPLIPDGWLL